MLELLLGRVLKLLLDLPLDLLLELMLGLLRRSFARSGVDVQTRRPREKPVRDEDQRKDRLEKSRSLAEKPPQQVPSRNAAFD